MSQFRVFLEAYDTFHRFFANKKFLSYQFGKGAFPRWFCPHDTITNWESRKREGERVVDLTDYIVNSEIKNKDPLFVVLMSVTGEFADGSPCGSLHVVFPFHLDTKKNWVTLLKSFKERYPQYGFLDTEAMSNGTLRGYLMGKGFDGTRPFVFNSFWRGLERIENTRDFLMTAGDEVYHQNIFRATSLRVSDDLPVEENPDLPSEDVLISPATPPQRPVENLSPIEAVRRDFLVPGPAFEVMALVQELEAKREEIDMNPDARLLDYLTPFNKIITDQLNKHIAFIEQAGKPLYVYRQKSTHGKMSFFHSTCAAAKARFSYKFMFVMSSKPNKVQTIECFDVWNSSPDRLFFEKVVFRPQNDHLPTELNCWTGYDFTEEMCQPYSDHQVVSRTRNTTNIWTYQSVLDHLYEFLCSKNAVVYRYMVHWLASILQRPWLKTKVAPVFISQEGIGKDLIFSDIMGAVLGPRHHFSTSNVEDLVGRFTASLEGKTLVVFDEADNIKDSHVSKLKNLITNPMMRVERKGLDTQMIENYVNTVFNTNVQTKSIMTIGPHSRRFVVVLCDSRVNSIPGYFEEMVEFLGINDASFAGVKAFAHYLYRIDLSQWNPRRIPHTRYLILMKLGTMPTVHRWWLDCLKKHAVIINNDINVLPLLSWADDAVEMSKSEFFNSFRTWNIHRHEDIDVSHFIILIKQVCPSLNTRRVGGHVSSTRDRTVIIPSMNCCRREFRNYYRGMSFEEEMDLTETIDVNSDFFLPDLRVNRAPQLDMIVDDGSQSFDVDQASQESGM